MPGCAKTAIASGFWAPCARSCEFLRFKHTFTHAQLIYKIRIVPELVLNSTRTAPPLPTVPCSSCVLMFPCTEIVCFVSILPELVCA